MAKIHFKITSLITLCIGMYVLSSCKTTSEETNALKEDSVFATETLFFKPDGSFIAHKTNSPIVIDGVSNEPIWEQTKWQSMNYLWMGEPVDSTDYYGKFKLSWDQDYLYILVKVTDDYLNPTLKEGIENYWKGDYVEVFIDEDRSGGDHKFNHQAFAYHVSTEGHAIDKNPREETVFLDKHVKVQRTNNGTTYLWELAIQLYQDDFDEATDSNKPVTINAEKRIGFSIAYGDNDGNSVRENFTGSKKSHGVNNDEGYVNADVFGQLLFVE